VAVEATYRRDGVDPLIAALQGSEKLMQLQIEVAAQEYTSANERFDTLLAATLALLLAGVAAAGLGWAGRSAAA